MQMTTGVAIKDVSIPGFAAEQEILPVIGFNTSRATTGRWSFCTSSIAVANPTSNQKTGLFGLSAGIGYDSATWSQAESIQDELGAYEITSMPTWLIRYYVQMGAWWYSDFLTISGRDQNAGYPVSGIMFGLQTGFSVSKFFSSRWSVSGGADAILPIQSFPLRFYTVSIALGYWHN